MLQSPAGSIRLFRVWDIDVRLHWSWFVVAVIQLQFSQLFDHAAWHLVMYLSLFGIVLLHEFGHALACRSVGGQANLIVLWPLGGVAFVRPPARPGAVLWSIAAGPLVNVLLVPVTVLSYAWVFGGGPDKIAHMSDPQRLFFMLCTINMGILFFNMLPIYPLDGGQILQALLWFVMGRARSLHLTTVIGMVAAGTGFVAAAYHGSMWLMVIALFIGWQSWMGYRTAQMLALWESQQDYGR